MASRAKKKWRYRQQEIVRDLKGQIISNGLADVRVEIDLQYNGQEKMSAVILDFVKPFAVDLETHEEFRKLVKVGLLAWNAALLPEEGLREKLDKISIEAIPPSAAADFQRILYDMIAHKLKYFAENRRLICAHNWTMTAKGPHLTVVSTTN